MRYANVPREEGENRVALQIFSQNPLKISNVLHEENGREVRKSTNAQFLRMWCGAYMHTMILPFRGVSKKVDR